MPGTGIARGGVAILALSCVMHLDCAPASEVTTSTFPEAEWMMAQALPPRAGDRDGFVLDTHRHVLTARVDSSPAIEIDTRGSHARIERLGATTKNLRARGNVLRTSGEAERFVFSRGEEIEELALLTGPTPLAYRLIVPDGFRLRALSTALVQIDDASGDPWLRMRADRAWSEDGREIAISLAVEDDVVRVVVPSDAPYPLLVDPVWASAASMVHPRDSHAATLLGDGRVLVTGGFAQLVGNTAEIYDPRTGLFTALEPTKMAAGRNRHASVMLRTGKVLLYGGNPLAPDAELFDPRTNTFTAVPSPSTMYVKTRPAIAAPLLDGRVLFKGVTSAASDAAPAAEIYDPTTNTFTATSPGTLPARGTMVTLANGKVLLFGECEVESWDPSTTSWTKLAGQFCSQPENRGVALMHDGRVLVTGGGLTCGPNDALCGSVRAYDPVAESYDVPTPLIEGDGRGASVTVLPSGKVLVSGSYTSTTSARIYDPSDNTFVKEADTTSAHRHQSVTMLPGGDVLVLGGEQNTADLRTWTGAIAPTNGNMVAARYAAATQRLKDGTVLIAGGSFHPPGSIGSTLASAEIYDPTTKTFSPTTGSMTTPRENAIAALLPSGKVLIAGGTQVGTNAAKATAEIYDPQTKTFTAIGSMSSARTRHAAARLPGGKILVTGGCTDESTCLVGLDASSSRSSSAEIFDPATETFTAASPMLVARSEHGLVTMPDGRVIVLGTEGQGGLNVEVYDPAKGLFDIVQSLFMPSDQHGRSALLLSSGKVFVGGGFAGPNLITDATAAAPSWTSSPGIGFTLMAAQYMPTPGASQLLLVGGVKANGNGLIDGDTAESRVTMLQTLVAQNAATVVTDLGAGAGRRDVATANVDRGILVAGGDSGYGGSVGSVTDTAYIHSDGADDARRPVLGVAPVKIKAGATSTLEGQRFTTTLGSTPVAFWQPSGSKTFLPARISSFSPTNASWTAPVTALHGAGWLHVVTDGIASNSVSVEVEAADNGTACKYGAECASGFCTEGVCCDQACNGACQACTVRRKGSGIDGTCATIQPGTDPDDKCVQANGGACSTDAACGSGFCVSGVCCNEACQGACRTCGTGTCVDTPTCGDAGPIDPPLECAGDHLLKKGDVEIANCGDYKCRAGVCLQTCASARDCKDDLVCSYDGACISPPAVRPGFESLFGCAATGRPSGSFGAIGVFFAFGIARIARRRGREPRRGAAR